MRLLLLVALPLALALVPPAARLLDNVYLITLVRQALIYALAAMALDFIMGYGRLVSFGHAAFFGLGAYTVGILGTHYMQDLALLFGWAGSNEALLAWPLAMAISGAYALLVGLISLRTSGIYFIMITLAFAQMVYYLFVSLSAYGGLTGLSLWLPNTIAGFDLLADGLYFYYLCLTLLLLAWWLLARIVASRFGQVLQGCRQNERRMRALGYRTYGYKLTAFVISGAVTGLAGALLANHAGYVSPGLMHWSMSGELIIIVLLGGLSSLIGPIYGAIILLLLEQLLTTITPYWQIILGPILILVVLLFKGGLYGTLTRRGSQA